MGNSARVPFAMKLLMAMLSFQFITLGLVLSLWTIEMGSSQGHAQNVVKMMLLFAAAAFVSPWAIEAYEIGKRRFWGEGA